MRFTFQLLAKHCEEDCEIDRTRSLLQHLVQLLLFDVETSCWGRADATNPHRFKTREKHQENLRHALTQSSKGVSQIILVNEAVSVLVQDGEGLRQSAFSAKTLKPPHAHGRGGSHLFKLLDLRLLKHREHVGVGSLCGPLLGFLGGLLGEKK